MGHLHSSTRPRDHHARHASHARDLDHRNSEIDALREENSQLRRLVIELSRLVIRNVVEDKH